MQKPPCSSGAFAVYRVIIPLPYQLISSLLLTNDTISDTVYGTINEKGNKMLEKIRILLSAIEFLYMFGQRPITGHQIANQVSSSMSRSTTYRYLEKSERAGFIWKSDDPSDPSWLMTDRGQRFLEAWNVLPF